MEKYYVGDDIDNNNEIDDIDLPPRSVEDLQNRLNKMVIFSELVKRGKRVFVRVMENTGTHHFMSSAIADHTYLNRHAEKKEKRGSATFYYFKF